MSELLYSSEAESVLSLFYNVDIMVYVEGHDDIPFWDFMFDKFTEYDIEIQDVGSCTALEPYMDKICSGELHAIVACDTDFTPFMEQRHEHHNIIRTPKYAIENTMISTESLAKSIKVMARAASKKIDSDHIDEWCNTLHERMKKLVLLDIYNAKNKLGISIATDNAHRFMKSKTSCELCDTKLGKHVESILEQTPEYDEEGILSEVEERGYKTNDFVRGHFLFSAALRFCSNYIKTFGINPSISNDTLYSALILSLETTFNESNRDYDAYREQFERLEVTT